MSHELWSIVLLVGLVFWIASTILFIVYSFPRRGEFVAKFAVRFGGMSIVFFMVWVAGLLNA